MKNILSILAILNMGFIPCNTFADAGPAIPVPEILVAEGVKETRDIDGNVIRKDEYILISATYTNYFQEKYEEEWAWRIEFIHPVQNDHSVVYKA